MRIAAPVLAVLALSCSVLTAIHSPKPGQSGIVAAYSFDEADDVGQADVTVEDTSGNGNTGRARAARRVEGYHGKALAFEGDGGVEIASSPSLRLTDAFTLEAWVKPARTGSQQVVVSKGNADYFLAWTTDEQDAPAGGMTAEGCAELSDGSDTCTFSATDPLPIDEWTHIAVSFDGETFRLFRNGEEIFTQEDLELSLVPSDEPLWIGMTGGTEPSDGSFAAIDDVRIYDRALSVFEIGDDMLTPVGASD